jgi:hypothetical protein
MTKLDQLSEYIGFVSAVNKKLKIKDFESFNENFIGLMKEMSKTKDIEKRKNMLFLFLYINTENKEFEKDE